MKLVIIGAGGHAKVVADTAMMAGWDVVGFLDDRPDAQLLNLPHLGVIADLLLLENTKAVIAIGQNQARKQIFEELTNCSDWATIIHPKAVVSSLAKIQAGTVVFAGSVIQADTSIGKHCIINTLASVDHDCHIDDYCHIAPNATLAGSVTLETGVFVGAGSVITPGRKIGEWSTLGAGAVLVNSLKSNGVFVGVPAKQLKRS